MDTQELRTLQILEVFEKQPTPSQRHLAKQLNISLGLVNSFIKRLAHKGYFKMTAIPRNRIKYILTPQGAAEKTRLTYKYIRYSFQFYSKARSKLRALFKDLEERGVKKIAFYGATDMAEIAYLYLQETAIQFVGLIDEAKEGKCFFGLIISPLDAVREMNFDAILITEIIDKRSAKMGLLNNGIHAGQVIEL